MESENSLLDSALSIIEQGHMIMCPSLGEYPVYDDMLYDMMSGAPDKIDAYRKALNGVVKDKIVVEVGTGSRAILALLCAEAGAKKVYAIEGGYDAANKAEQLIKSEGLEDIIKIISGYSSDVELPEKADVCVSEIIGNIGSSEGVITILDDAKRFLKDDGHFVPENCITRIAPVFLPGEKYEDEFIKTLLDSYTEKVYESVGFKFPFTRFAVYNFPESNIIADAEIFEDIDFNSSVQVDMERTIQFKVPRQCDFDGFLLWVELYVDNNNIVNTFNSLSWAPVYIKAKKMMLKTNDTIEMICSRKLSKNKINPDYFFQGSILRDGKVIDKFYVDSYHTSS